MSDSLTTNESREATSSIRGYVYQIYQSLHAWMSLSDDELLILERAEDFDIHDADTVTAVQVKHADDSSSITLRTESVVAAINNYWRLKKDNPDHNVSFHYLTTSRPGVEQGNHFDGVAGIDFWRQSRISPNEIKRIADFLISIPKISEDLKSFLSTSEVEEIKGALIDRIQWNTGRRSLEGFVQYLKDKVVTYGNGVGVTHYDSERAFDSLLSHVINAITHVSSQDRFLNKAGFIRCFEKATLETLPKQQLQLLQMAASAPVKVSSEAIFDAPLPRIRGLVSRESVVSDCASKAEQASGVFLYGSTGLGKSYLAELISEPLAALRLWIDCRSLDPKEIARKLFLARSKIDELTKKSVIVIDDLDLSTCFHFQRELISLLFAIKSGGHYFIVTGPHPANAEIIDRLWLAESANFAIPYFSIDDVRAMLLGHGFSGEDIEKEAAYIHVFGKGHPQLVHAIIKRLSTYGDSQERLDALIKSSDASSASSDIRRRLTQETPSEAARTLLYRISIAFGTFSRSDAIALAGLEPKIRLAAEAFDVLVGPWIESVGGERYRRSPLTDGISNGVIDSQEIKMVHEYFALSPIRSGVKSYDDVSDAIMHALACRTESVVAQIAVALSTTPRKHFEKLSFRCYWFICLSLKPGEKIYKENLFLDGLLRVLQFRLASAAGHTDLALSISNILSDIMKGEKIPGIGLDTIIPITILSDINTPISPKITVPLLSGLVKQIDTPGLFDDVFKNIFNKSRRGLKPLQSFLMFEAARHNGTAYLDDFVGEFDKLDGSSKKELASVFSDYAFVHQLINSSWWKDERNGNLNTEEAIKILRKAKYYGEKWGFPLMVMEALISESVLLNEYDGDQGSAMAALVEAELFIGRDASQIFIAKSKIYMEQKDYVRACEHIESALLDESLGSIDASYACRNLGIAYAARELWKESSEAFLRGTNFSEKTKQLHVMYAGFFGDASYSLWMSGDKNSALNKLNVAARLLEKIPFDGTLRNRHIHAVMGHLCAWFLMKSNDGIKTDMSDPVPGMCSNQSPHKDIATMEVKSAGTVGGLINIVAASLGLQLEQPINVPDDGMPLILQATKRTAQIQSISRGNNLIIAPKLLIELYEAIVLQAQMNSGDFDPWSVNHIPKLPSDYWIVPKNIENLSLALVSVCVVALAKNELSDELIATWRDSLSSAGVLSEQLEFTLSQIICPDKVEHEVFVYKAARAVGLLRKKNLSPRQAFRCHFYILNATHYDLNKMMAEFSLEAIVSQDWSNIVATQRFALNAPNIYAKDIAECCGGSSLVGASKVAKILLLAAPAVGVQLDEATTRFLGRLLPRDI